MGIALLGSMMLFGCRKIGETAPETASAGTSYVSEETAGESKTETKATEPPAPTEDPAPEPLVPEAIEPTPAEDALPEGMVKSYLTGEPVAEVQGRRRPVAVMLSNIISACPQSGISRAGVIYEAPVEGGITRLMGLFENYDDLEKIGSVRSCREYYVYLAAGFDALYYHYGQAAYAIPLLESDHIDNVNGMEYSEQVYYRTSDRPSPHNAYLDAAGIAAGIDLCGYRTSYKDGYDGFFQFASETEPETLEQGRNAAYVAPGGYFHNNPWFSYDEASGMYLRYQFGEPQIDEMTQEQLAVKNIIVQYCSWKKYDDNAEYLDIDVVNGGTGTYITSGKAIDVTWSKDDPWGVTKYRDGNGDEIKLNPGKTWVLIVLDNYTDETEIR